MSGTQDERVVSISSPLIPSVFRPVLRSLGEGGRKTYRGKDERVKFRAPTGAVYM